MKYLCREDILAEGARLFRACANAQNTSGEKAAGEALQAWQKRHQPSRREKLAVLRMVNNPYV